jgi:uncharacterized GH25 family protein
MWKLTRILLIIAILLFGCSQAQEETPVTIQVLNQNNKPLPNITVEILPSLKQETESGKNDGYLPFTRTTDENGQVDINLPQGKVYEIYIQAVRDTFTVPNKPITVKIKLDKVYLESKSEL